MLIGLTGQIGSGKSTAAKILASFGAIVLDADQIGRQVVDNSPALRRKLARAFGDGVIRRDGHLNRRCLAKLAFVDEESKVRLNRHVHPYLLRRLKQLSKTLSKQNRPVIIDAALLLDWGMDKEVDIVIVVTAPRQLRLSRLAARHILRQDALARERAQLPYKTYKSKADYFITNSGDKRELRRKLRDIWRMLSTETR